MTTLGCAGSVISRRASSLSVCGTPSQGPIKLVTLSLQREIKLMMSFYCRVIGERKRGTERDREGPRERERERERGGGGREGGGR